MRNAPNAPARLPFLSQTAEHALRAILYLGRNQGRGLISAAETADALGAPPNYLSKTLRLLARRGLLKSSRGPRGGFELAFDIETITAAQVMEAVDEVASPANCLLGGGACDPTRPCAAHERWSTLRERVLGPMQDTTIADLLGPSASRTTPDLNAPSR